MANDKRNKPAKATVRPAPEPVAEPVVTHEPIGLVEVFEPATETELVDAFEASEPMPGPAVSQPPSLAHWMTVTPETATHVAVMTRGQAKFYRIGRCFTPDVVEIDLVREWPNEAERAECVRSLVSESASGGSLEVEFMRR